VAPSSSFSASRASPCRLEGHNTLLHERGIKLRASTALEFLQGDWHGPCDLIGTGGVHRCKRIGDGDQARPGRDGWTGQPLWRALSVPALVVRIDQQGDRLIDAPLPQEMSPRGTMLLHERIFRRREPRWFVQEGPGEGQFAHVVYERGPRDYGLLLFGLLQKGLYWLLGTSVQKKETLRSDRPRRKWE